MNYSPQTFKKLIRWGAFLGALLTLTLGCVKKNPSEVSSIRSGSITITGQVVLSSGEGAASAAVFAGQLEEMSTQADASGNFSFSLSADQLLVLKGKSNHNQNTYHLYFFDATSGERGVSSPISFSEHGISPMGTISLGAPQQVSGIVKFLPANKGLKEGSGAAVTIGNQTIVTGQDGSFNFDAVPSGSLPISVAAKNFVPFYDMIDTTSNPSEMFEGPIVLFTEYGVSGALIAVPLTENEYKNETERFTRQFLSKSSRETKWIRYHHDPKVLTTQSIADQQRTTQSRTQAAGNTATTVPLGKSPSDLGDFWFDAEKSFEYHFPAHGGHTLYYQYANQDKTEFSPIYQINVDVNVFHDTDGFVIGDGSGITQSARVRLNINVPAAANRMRIAEADIINAPWQAAAPTMEYIFKPTQNADRLGRKLYIQFADAFGSESVVYERDVTLDLFNTIGPVIAGGDGLINSPLVVVQTNPPADTTQIRIGDNKTPITTAPWTTVQNQIFHFLEGSSVTGGLTGDRVIQVQYQNAHGFISPIFEASAKIELFPSTDKVFTINGGAEATIQNTIFLDIDLPQNAYEMRVFVVDHGLDITVATRIFTATTRNQNSSENYWMKAAPFFTYVLDQPGVHDVYVQFRDPNGYTSPTYKQVIDYEPFPKGEGAFAINGGAPITSDPMLLLEINPPEIARSVAFEQRSILTALAATSGGLTDIFTGSFFALTPTANYEVSGRGMKNIVMQFRGDAGYKSPLLQQSIFYEPFPLDPLAIIINGGASVTDKTTLYLDFNVPFNATGMRYSDDLTTLSTLPWLAPAPNGVVEIPNTIGNHKIFLQFQNPFGEESIVYSDDIILQPIDFVAPANIVQINGGAVSTENESVIVTANLPAEAVEVKIGETLGDTWLAATTSYPLTLTTTDGLHTVFLQYRTADGRESSVYFDSIILDNPSVPQWEVADDLIVINNGDAVTSDPELNISLNMPAKAVEFRISSNPTTLQSAPYLTKTDSYTFTVPTARGIQTIYIQMRDQYGKESGVYFDSIDLEPIAIPGDVADDIILVNNNDTTTDDREVTVQLNLPASATEFQINESSSSLSSSPWLAKVSSYTLTLSDSEGVRAVYIKYRNSEEIESSIYFDTIILDYPTSDDYVVSEDIIRINNNDAFTTDQAVTLSFDIPDEAYEIRFSETAGSGTWISAVDAVPFTLGSATGVHSVYFQYRTKDGPDSPIFFDSIILGSPDDLSDFSEDMITINEGAATTTLRPVNLNLTLPDEAELIRFSEDPAAINNVDWQAKASIVPFTLTSGDGVKIVYMQYQTTAGLESPLFSDTIILDEASAIANNIIVINNDDIETTSKDVTLTVNLPAEAVSIRFSENPELISSESWTDVGGLTDFAFELVETDTVHMVYMQYRTSAGLVSPLFSDSIALDTAADPTDVIPDNIFVINNDDAITTATAVTLNFNLPSEAAQVRYGTSSDLSSEIWIDAPSSAPFVLTAPDGDKTVYMEYRTALGIMSPVFSDTIELDEP